MLSRKSAEGAIEQTVPQTDTGGRVEQTEVDEATPAKELGNLAP